TGTPRSAHSSYTPRRAGSSGEKAPCTGCSLTATAPRPSWRAAPAAGAACTAGVTLATRGYRAGVWGVSGRRAAARLVPGGPRTVLGEQQGSVDTLGVEQGVEPGRDRVAVWAEYAAPG